MKQERINEIIGLMFLAISLFTFWSLLTYDVHDNPFFTSHPNTTIHNGAGLIGAYLSYFLMFAFGYSSYTFPLIFLFWAISFLVQKIPVKLFFKIVGFLIFQSSTATVFSLLSPEARQFAMGGIWGYFLSANLSTYFGFGGGLIIAIACFLLSFILATEFLIFPFLTKGFVALMEICMNKFTELKITRGKSIIPDFTTETAQPRIKRSGVKKSSDDKKSEEKKGVFEKAPPPKAIMA